MLVAALLPCYFQFFVYDEVRADITRIFGYLTSSQRNAKEEAEG